MRDLRHERIQRELFLAAFGANVGASDSWVTDRLTSLLEEQVARAGETLFVAGDPPEFYYFLREGRVELTRNGSVAWNYEGPSVFGLSDALLERPRVRTAKAVSDIQAMRVQAEAWIELLEDSFSLARAAVVGSVRTVAEMEQRLWAVGRARKRSTAATYTPRGDDVMDRLAVLTAVPLLRGAGVQTLSDLAAASEVIAFARDEVLVARGKSVGRVLLVLEGTVEARREAPDVLWRGQAGDIVCGTAAFDDASLAWEACARTPGRALTFRIADWLDLMEEHFDMVRTTLGTLSLDRDELLELLR
ncbi:MAG TPA: cyclic nucleotide-binding domain-containing protein [Polyangiaceae bacterium]|jgi:CRP-like cAMP-binding protein